MSSRRGHFPELTIGAWIAALMSLPIGVGCIPGTVSGGPPIDIQNGTGGAPGAGSGGSGGPRGTGGASATAALACSGTPAGCVCADRDAQPSDLATCCGTVVAKNVGEQGSCCKSSDLCTCDAFACRSNPALSFCQCGRVDAIDVSLGGAASAECPAPATGQKCCLIAETKTCSCSPSDCDQGAMMVSNCTVAMVAVCAPDQQVATSCK